MPELHQAQYLLRLALEGAESVLDRELHERLTIAQLSELFWACCYLAESAKYEMRRRAKRATMLAQTNGQP